MFTTPGTYPIIPSRSALLRAVHLGALTLGTVASAAGAATFVDTALRATHADATLLWSLLALLASALTACLAHLLITLTLTALIGCVGAHTLLGSGLLSVLKVFAPRAARRVMIMGTTAGCAVALAASPGYAHTAPPAPTMTTVGWADTTAEAQAEAPTDTAVHNSAPGTANQDELAGKQDAAPLTGLGWASTPTPQESQPAASGPAAAPHNAGTSTESSAQSGTRSSADTTGTDAKSAARGRSVTVQPGDSLWSISRAQLTRTEHSNTNHSRTQHNRTDHRPNSAQISRYVERVIAANPSLEDPDLIQPGEHITLPAPGR